MKKKLLILFALTVTLFSLPFSFLLTANAEESTEPTISIEKFNLVFDDNVYLKYGVKFDGIEDENITSNTIGMLYFTESQEEYTESNASFSSSGVGYTTIDEVKYYTFEYRNLSAKQMTDYVYSVAYIDIDEARYYSEPVKYSVLDYAYVKLGKTGTASSNQEFKDMLSSMLVYGANAQRYFDYNTDRLADAEYFSVEVVGGTFEDGFTKGLYHAGESATLTAPEVKDGLAFASWVNSAGETVSKENPFILNNFTANETYTATYKKGLAFTSNGDGTCSVSGVGGCTDTDIVIPSVSPAGDTVTSIAEQAFFENTNITSVVMPDSITSIGDGAFYGCKNLASVTLSKNLTSIGYALFSECTKLTSVVIPDSLTSIPMYTFYGCQNLTSVTIGNSVKSIDLGAFYNCGFTSVEIPDSVTTIGDGAFKLNANLTSVVMPDSVTSINDGAFDECPNLTSVYYKGTESDWSAISIGEYNTQLTGATRYSYSEAKPTIMGNFWHYVDGVVTVWPSLYSKGLKFTSNNNGTCYISGIGTCTDTDIIIPSKSSTGDSVTSIGANAFKSNTTITSVTIPNSVTSIDTYAFYGCTNLASVVIPNSVTSIGDYAFYKSAFTSVEIPTSVTSIGNSAFRWCTGLTSVVIPDSVTSIGEFTFANNANFTSVVIGSNVTSIGAEAFYGCSLTTVYYKNIQSNWDKITKSSNSNLTSATLYCYSENAPINAGNFWHYVDGVVTVWPGMLAFTSNNNGTCYISGIGSCTDTDIIIPSISPAGDTVTSIGNDAFKNCTSITSVEIPDSVTSIGTYAFYGCTSLTNMEIPDGVTSIGDYAFYGCKNIASIEIPDGVTSIGDYAFRDCDSFISVEIPGNVTSIGSWAFSQLDNLTNVVIHNGVTSISKSMFYYCQSLTDIVIPVSVTSIGDYAFYNCTSLAKVYYGGTASNWSAISKGTDNTKFTGATRYYYSENAPTATGNFWHYVDGVITVWPGMLAFTSNGNGTCSVSGIGSCKDSDIVIPSKSPAGDSVTSIGANAFKDKTTITSVVIPEGVTSIDTYAFYGCTNLINVEISNSVTSIGDYAFRKCTSLTSIIIPDSVTSIGEFTFANNANFTSVVIGSNVKTIAMAAFYGCSLTNVYYKNTQTDWGNITIGSENTVLTNATRYYYSETAPTTSGKFWHYVDGVATAWPRYVSPDESLAYTSNGDGTCYVSGIGTCTAADEIIIPQVSPEGDRVTSIGMSAFKGCTELTKIVIPDTVTQIGNYAFQSCTKLVSVEIPNSVTSLGSYAFNKCTALKSVELSNKLTTVPSYAFDGCSVLASIVIPEGVTKIADYTFQNCSKLTSVTLPASLTSIGTYAFKSCQFTSITLPSSLTSIGNYAFQQNSKLTSITIPEGVTKIADYTFQNCTNLTSVTLPDALTSIGKYAFQSCKLTSITLPGSLTSIGDYAFKSCQFTSITLPGSLTSIGNYAFQSSKLTSITLPANVTKIGKGAFANCSSLTSIKFENTAYWFTSSSSPTSGGAQLNVTKPATNVTYFTDTYRDYYWYKNVK